MTRKGGKPPVEYQFQKSQTGNPNGRPRGTSKTKTSVFDIIVEAELTLKTGEATTTMSAEEALHLKTYQQAITGDKSAWAELLDMIIARQIYIDAHAPPPPGIEFQIEHSDPKNAYEAMTILGIASYDDKRRRHGIDPTEDVAYLLLESWAVQLALDRPALSTLSKSAKGLVEAWTRDHKSLKWPPRFGHGRH